MQARGPIGQNVGAYTLVSQIGQGGMGSVWLARRSDGRFERQAAVKFVNIALTGRATEERFKREGSILGRLTHPHIAGLLDAGISPDGSPYLILEYVDGVAIDQYCDQHMLDVDARVKLFLDVLSAVAEAHAHLIVHRDIKPSNVLVRNDGQVKLLDFGIAKLLAREGDTAPATMLTMEGGGAHDSTIRGTGTSDGRNRDHGHRCVRAGRAALPPVDGAASGRYKRAFSGRPGESDCRMWKHREHRKLPWPTVPQRKSAAPRPAKLSRQLSGDLDTILGKALKKNPQERYVSVTAFADDLRRYLQHEAISVRPDTFAYRTAKFLRRNRTVVALTATAIAW